MFLPNFKSALHKEKMLRTLTHTISWKQIFWLTETYPDKIAVVYYVYVI